MDLLTWHLAFPAVLGYFLGTQNTGASFVATLVAAGFILTIGFDTDAGWPHATYRGLIAGGCLWFAWFPGYWTFLEKFNWRINSR